MTIEDAIGFLNTDDYESAGYGRAIGMSIEALRKQIPLAPKMPLDAYFLCPICARVIDLRYDNYCRNCGQKIARGLRFEVM